MSTKLLRWTEKHYVVIVALLLIAFAVQSILFMRQKTLTFDEVGHLTQGYYYLKTHEYNRFSLVHPPTIMKLSAIPLLFSDRISFPYESEACKGYDLDHWKCIHEFYRHNTNNFTGVKNGFFE